MTGGRQMISWTDTLDGVFALVWGMTKGAVAAVLLLSAQLAMAEAFSFNQVPRGKSVTLPTMTRTVVAAIKRIRVTSTDYPQTLKISHRSKSNQPMAIAIYDRFQNRVRYATIHPRRPVLYTFRDLGAIDIVAMNIRRGVDLAFESNGPTGFSH